MFHHWSSYNIHLVPIDKPAKRQRLDMSPTAITEQPATNGKAKVADPLLALDKVLPVLSRNPLKDRMHAGNFSPCYYIQMVSSPEVLNLAKLAGYHATVLNLEHHKTGIETASDICLAALNRG